MGGSGSVAESAAVYSSHYGEINQPAESKQWSLTVNQLDCSQVSDDGTGKRCRINLTVENITEDLLAWPADEQPLFSISTPLTLGNSYSYYS